MLKTPARLISGAAAIAIAILLAPEASAWECRGVLIRQKGPSQTSIGATVTYDIEIRNEDSCELTGARITNFLPRRTQFVSADPTPLEVIQLPVGKVTWPPQDLKAEGGEARFQVKVVAGDPAGRLITNTVCVEHAKIGRVCEELDTFIVKARD